MTTFGRPSAVDLFCGAGGLSLGLEQAGFDVLAAVDIDPLHGLTHHYNHPSTAFLCADVASVRADDVCAAARCGAEAVGRPWTGTIDVLAGGPSCQGFSVIGARAVSDPRNLLIFEFARLVAEIRPRYFIFENVPGLLAPRFAQLFAQFTALLRMAGFELGTSPWLLDAQEYGVPQRRKRLFLVGYRQGERPPSRPATAPSVSSRDAIGDLEGLRGYPRMDGANGMTLRDDELSSLARVQTTYSSALRENRSHLAAPRIWNRRALTGVAATNHSKETLSRLARLAPGVRESLSKLPRLDPERPSPTLRAGTGREHGSHTTVRPVHYSRDRVITVREAARLHGFPDWYGFHSTRWHAFRQIGNSVPPELARRVGASIIKAIGGQPEARGDLSLGDPAALDLSLGEAAEVLSVPPELLPPPRRKAA
jgi:DNA (cytosine-5)-methyltransferase 1